MRRPTRCVDGRRRDTTDDVHEIGAAVADREIREPIHQPWIWIVLAVLMLVSIPWYLPSGSVAFVWFGVPMWMLISIVGTLGMCAYVSWLCFTQWDVVEAEEEAARQDGTDRPGTEG